MPALHAFEDQIVARLDREMEMRQKPRLLRDQAPELVVDLDRIERGEAQALELGHECEQAPAELAEGGLPGKIGAEAGQIDAGQHQLAKAGIAERARLADDLADRHRTAVAAAEGNDAEGAAVVAALLRLDKGARAVLETVDEMRGGFFERHDVADGDPRRARAVALGFELLRIAENQIDLFHRRVALRVDLCGAACDDESRFGVLATGAADRLA